MGFSPSSLRPAVGLRVPSLGQDRWPGQGAGAVPKGAAGETGSPPRGPSCTAAHGWASCRLSGRGWGRREGLAAGKDEDPKAIVAKSPQCGLENAE